MIRVVLVDGQNLVRTGIRGPLELMTASVWWVRRPTASRPWVSLGRPNRMSCCWTSACVLCGADKTQVPIVGFKSAGTCPINDGLVSLAIVTMT